MSQAEAIETSSGQGGMAETGFNQLGSTLCQQEPGIVREDEVKEETELSPWESLSCKSNNVTFEKTLSGNNFLLSDW